MKSANIPTLSKIKKDSINFTLKLLASIKEMKEFMMFIDWM